MRSLATAAAAAAVAIFAAIGASNRRRKCCCYRRRPPIGDPVAHVLTNLAAAGIPAENVTVRTSIQSKFMNAVSFELAGDRNLTDVVAALPVENYWPVASVPRPAAVVTEDATPALSNAAAESIHIATGVNDARTKLGLTGKGIKIAVIDTGTYYLHPALGGGFGPGFKVAFGYDLVGDKYDGSSASIHPDADPLDNCSAESHGTHVSGIVAGDASNITNATWAPPVPWTGVAPGATLGAYKVFGCAGETAFDIIANAIFKAAEDGADVINMSLGVGPAFSDFIASAAVDRVSAAGVIVLSSSGNDNDGGMWVVASPANAELGLAVASFDNYQTVRNRGYLDGSPVVFAEGGTNHSFSYPVSFNLSTVVVSNSSAIALNLAKDGCVENKIPKATSTGLALLVYYAPTSCGTDVKCNNAFSRGYSYCFVFFSESFDNSTGVIGGDRVPTIGLDFTVGSHIFNAVNTRQQFNLTLTAAIAEANIVTAGTVSSFSSGGLTPELLLKPDIGGIGGRVLSCVSQTAKLVNNYNTYYAVLSGTSMASPYVAGSVALLLEAKGKLSFDQVKTALLNAARPSKIYQSDIVDTPARQGAGLVQIYDAITSNTTVTPPLLSLNDTVRTHQHYTLTIANNFNFDVDYTVSSAGAAMVSSLVHGDDVVQTDTNYTADYGTVTFDGDTLTSKTITISAKSSRTINAHFTPPASADPSLFPIYTGYITVTNPSSSAVVTVPYAGVVGDWTARAVFTRTSPTMAQHQYPPAGLRPYFLTSPALPPPTTPVNVSTTPFNLVLNMAATARFADFSVAYAGNDSATADRLRGMGLDPRKDVMGVAVGVFPSVFGDPGPTVMRFDGNVPRNTPAAGVQTVRTPTLWWWRGDVTVGAAAVGGAVAAANVSVVRLPAGMYSVKARALKMFGRVGAAGDADYDVVEATVTIVH
ncbi:peptidase S8/S53 domain-containing protein [Zopfochytrium polystomum]|nr:peptidase S8/S53 domain-containing protein [Zopfochytrium polystomum]